MIYLDNNATTAVAPEVAAVMNSVLGGAVGNPSSAHAAGRAARRIVDHAREQTAALLGAASPGEIVFTSGGSEADNTAILSALTEAPHKKHIVTTRVEHEAVRKPIEHLEREGYRVSWIDVDQSGNLDVEAFEAALAAETVLVSVMLANNETGVLFPVEKLSQIAKSRTRALFHVDGVNAAGKVRIDLQNSAIDLFSISAHKFHGPKGAGALYIRDGVGVRPMLVGGGQESGRRAGTEAVHQIAGLGAAAEFAAALDDMSRVRELRDRLEFGILNKIPNSRLNGTSDPATRLANTTNISFENLNGEMILDRLDGVGVCVSTGSACNAENHTASPVLRAMDVPYSSAMGSIRFSLGRFNTADEIDRVLDELPTIIENLRLFA